MEELKNSFTDCLNEFNQRQKERNKCSKARRIEENLHIQLVERIGKELNDINIEKIKELKQFATTEENEDIQNGVSAIMINNGKDEKVKFNEDVVNKSILARTQIAKKEAECYIAIYDRTRKLLNEIENEDIKMEKYQKTLRDVSVKLEFLKAEKEYIVSFLDNERMTAINGLKAHKAMMKEACEKFELDIEQFENLYQLILKEISGKSTKKSYNELYNKQYLKNIEEKERNFEEAITNIRLNAGTIINSNYWRIDGIKNIYEVFQNEVTSKFGKDLSEYKLEEAEIENDDMLSYDFSDSDDIEQENGKDIENVVEEEFEDYIEDEDYEEDEEFFENDYDEEDEIEEFYDDSDEDMEDLDDEEDDEYDEDDDDYYDEDLDDQDEFYEDETEEDSENESESESEEEHNNNEENEKIKTKKVEIKKNKNKNYDDEYEYDNLYKYNYELDDSKDKKTKKKTSQKTEKDKNSKGIFNKFFKDKNK